LPEIHGAIDHAVVPSPVRREQNMTAHKYSVGQSVRFSPDRNQEVAARGSFTVVRLLPEEASILQYRVKSQFDGHERVVREDQLARS
jgi:hypothetical protein